jgi:hypothetical protein
VQNGWGAKVVELLANDISKEVPKVKGFSKRNLLYMRNFAKSYPFSTIVKMNDFEAAFNPDTEIVQQLVARLEVIDNQPSGILQQPVAQMDETLFLNSIIARVTWSHHIVLMDKEPSIGKRFWYMINAIQHSISRNILAMQIESNLYERQVANTKINNFKNKLPKPQTDFVNYLLKDPYIFDFVQAT